MVAQVTQLNPPKTFGMIPQSIKLDHDEIKRLKAVKLISLELYVRWALILTYGQNTVTLSEEKWLIFAKSGAFVWAIYSRGLRGNFPLLQKTLCWQLLNYPKKKKVALPAASNSN